MIGVIFNYGNDVVEVRIKGEHAYFRTTQSPQFATIDGLKMDRSGVFKEFPDLKDKEDWQKQARERFKSKLKEMKTEQERIKYIIKDLSKFGYIPRYLQRDGHRPIKL